MKHIQKFNEAKKRTPKEVDPIEKLEEVFFEFIESAAELGKFARSEQSHSNGVSNKEDSNDAIKEYGKVINEMNSKFEKFKKMSTEVYK